MKNKLILVLLTIALLIPSFIAIAYYAYMSATPVEQREFSRVEITGGDGKTFVLERGNDKTVNSTLDFFVNMNKNAQEIDYKPELDDQYKIKFVYYHYSEGYEFDYYFPMTTVEDALSVSGGYYVNSEDRVFKLAETDVKEFVATTYARSLYSGIDMPQLLLSGSSDVTPQEVKWTFREVGGKYVNYDTSYQISNDVQTCEIASDFGMRFTVEPDVFLVKITQGGTLLYEGDYASLVRSLDLDEEKPVSFEVTAQWSESLSTRYAGEISYRFDASLIPPPTFTLTTSDYVDGAFTLEQGGVAVITGKNIKDPANITFTSSIELGYEPKWYTHPETGTVYAMVPIAPDLDAGDATEITFTVSSGGTSSTLTAKFADKSFTTLDGLNEGHFESEMKTILASLTDPADGTNYLNGAFANPLLGATSKGIRGYGRKADGEYIHIGADFKDVTEVETVHAGAGGTVVYAGQFSTGENVVVIDHGLGLRSWYVNFDVDGGVIVGDKVESGAVLGTCQEGVNLHCSITVGDVAVSPYKFWAFTATYSDYLLLK